LINLLLHFFIFTFWLLELSLFGFNIDDRFFSNVFILALFILSIFFLFLIIFRFVFNIFLSLRNGSIWKLNLTFNLHSFIFLLHFLILTLCKEIFKFSFKKLSLIFREMLRILLILRIELLKDFIFLFLCQIIISFTIKFIILIFILNLFMKRISSLLLFLLNFRDQWFIEKIHFRFFIDLILLWFLLLFPLNFKWFIILNLRFI